VNKHQHGKENKERTRE